MKLLKRFFVLAGLLAVLAHGAVAQGNEPQLATPNAASIAAGKPRYFQGELFSFQLRFNAAPEGFGGGQDPIYVSEIGL